MKSRAEREALQRTAEAAIEDWLDCGPHDAVASYVSQMRGRVAMLEADRDALIEQKERLHEEVQAVRGANTEQGDRIELLQGDLIEAIQATEHARTMAAQLMAGGIVGEEVDPYDCTEPALLGRVLYGGWRPAGEVRP